MNTNTNFSFLTSKLFRKFLLWFLVIALIPAFYLSYSSFNKTRQIIEKIELNTLISIAEERAHTIDNFLSEREKDINAQIENPFIIDAMETMIGQFTRNGINSAQYKLEEKRISPFLSSIQKQLELHDLFFISPDGDIVFTVAKEADLGNNLLKDAFKDTELEKVFNSALSRKVTSISPLKIYDPSNEPTSFVAAPVIINGHVLGILVFQLDHTLINTLATNYIGLGESGEIVIASLEGEYAVVSAPLRHDTLAAFKMKIKIGSFEALPIQNAVNGNKGSGISIDYRGKEVLSAWTYIPKINWGLVVKIDTEEAFAPAVRFLTRTLLIGVITVLFVLMFAIFVSRSIVNPIIRLKQGLGSISRGEFPAKFEMRSRDEIGEMNESVGKVIDSFGEVVSKANIIASGDYLVDIVLRSKNDELGIALQKMTGSLRKAKEENEASSWLKAGQSELDNQMRGEQNTEKLSRNIITFICKYINAEIGTLYLNNGNDVFCLKASYAYKARKNLSSEFKSGEGLVGQAALEKQSIILRNVPDDYIYVTSAIGEKMPKNILVTPFTFNDDVVGVLEIGSFSELTEMHMQLLENISDGIAIAVNSAQARIKLSNSLEKTQQQAEELQHQQEEMETTNEELKNQTEALEKSEEKLIAQQEELQVSNEELEEKTQFLEEQKDETVKKNKELESAQRNLKIKAQDLEITSKYKSEFLANMSHELRTPLNSLLILAQQLSQNKKNNLDNKQVEAAKIIYSSGNDLLKLINEILDLSRIESGKMNLNIEDFHIDDVAGSINANFKHLIEKKGLKLDININPDLSKIIRTDRQRLDQIIKNLMSNAMKFTEKGVITVDFYNPAKDVDLSRSGLNPIKTVAIAVTDTGLGIPEDKRLQIFEAFQQVDGSTSRKYGGTGLGLSISRELARLLGGEIQLKSSEGEGSTFTIYIPEMFQGTKEEDFKTEFQQEKKLEGIIKISDNIKFKQSPAIEDDRKNIKEKDRVIMVIEDDLNFAKTLYEFCHEKQFKCIHAGDGESGLELVHKYPVDAIILDIRLPGIEGWGVLEALKDNPKTRHIPVHIMSVEEKSIDAMRKGAIGYVTKPVKEQQLNDAFTKIGNLLSKKIKELLVVEDDRVVRDKIVDLIGNGDIKINTTNSGMKAITELKKKNYDCVILDLVLPDISGFDILEKLEKAENISIPPIIIYTAKDLSREETERLQKYTDSIIIKGVKSDERLFDESSLFLHRIFDNLPAQKRKLISKLHDKEMLFENKKVLLVDDDMRNVFAISQVLEEKGVNVLKAANGKMALETLEKEKDIDLVLMDIMMPVMDGYEAIRKVRDQERFWKLPILALTAKAMKDDRDKCIVAGANDYLPKPIDIDRLLSLMRVWLYK